MRMREAALGRMAGVGIPMVAALLTPGPQDDLALAAGAAGYPRAYSVAFETQLTSAEFGLSRARHFQIANEALQAARA